MKFKIGDKVKIKSCSCSFPQDFNNCCKKYRDGFPYMVIKEIMADGKIWIITPNNTGGGCSGYKEKDLILYGQLSFKNLLED